MGDLNTKLREGSTTNLIGPYGLRERKERGDRQRLEDFAIENDLVVTNTLFQQGFTPGHHPTENTGIKLTLSS